MLIRIHKRAPLTSPHGTSGRVRARPTRRKGGPLIERAALAAVGSRQPISFQGPYCWVGDGALPTEYHCDWYVRP